MIFNSKQNTCLSMPVHANQIQTIGKFIRNTVNHENIQQNSSLYFIK